MNTLIIFLNQIALSSSNKAHVFIFLTLKKIRKQEDQNIYFSALCFLILIFIL